MSTPLVVVHHDADVLAEAVAARLITRIADVQAARLGASVVLTGGGVGTATLAAVAAYPRGPPWTGRIWTSGGATNGSSRPETPNATRPRRAPRYSTMSRSTPIGSTLCPHPTAPTSAEIPMPQRNSTQPRQRRRHDPRTTPACPRSTCSSSAWDRTRTSRPCFPINRRCTRAGRSSRCTERRSRRPIRLTLTLPAIRAAEEVWLVAAERRRRPPSRLALSGGGEVQVPAAGARGRHRTLWLLDRAAASAPPRAGAHRLTVRPPPRVDYGWRLA